MQMVEQVQKAIWAFETSFPDDIAVFAFDNSSRHALACKAKDALVANRMNLGPGGKQPIMRNTVWGEGVQQHMVYEEGDREWGEDGATGSLIKPELIGKPKGMKHSAILQEYRLISMLEVCSASCKNVGYGETG